MTATTPCYRHRRRTWMLACPDCTAWHLAAALARRDEPVPVRGTAGTPDVVTSPPAATEVAPVALRLVA
jgi:hypothetical protein